MTRQQGVVLMDPNQEVQLHARYESNISFAPFVRYLKDKMEETDDIRTIIYRFIIRKFEARPDLLVPFKDMNRLQDIDELMNLLRVTITPLTQEDNETFFALSGPFDFRLIYCTDLFRKTFLRPDGSFNLPEDITWEDIVNDKYMQLYRFILERFYNIQLQVNEELTYAVPDQETGLTRHYQITFDKRFIDFRFKGERLPSLEDEVVCHKTYTVLNEDQLKASLPLEDFELEGFVIWKVTDITAEASVSEIKNIILHMQHLQEEEAYDSMGRAIRNLISRKGVEVGLFPFLKVESEYCIGEDKYNGRSFIMNSYRQTGFSQKEFVQMVVSYASSPRPIIIPDLNAESLKEFPALKPLLNSGIRSYVVYPIQNQEGFIGVLELASYEPLCLDYTILGTLETIVPLLSQALDNYIHHFQDQLDQVIKEKFTTLQPSVEWKFNQVATDYLRLVNAGQAAAKIGDVRFEDVFPLYGAIDVRNSTFERTLAIRKDLIEQMQIIDSTMEKLIPLVNLPLFEEIQFKSRNCKDRLHEGLTSEDEVRINEFLLNEVDTTLRHLEKIHPEAKPIIDEYFRSVDPENGHVNHFRRSYERSLAQVTDAVNKFIEKERDRILQAYPFYFEKYRTDGVEYNLYIGQSITPTKPFDGIYVRNLRLWQLTSMAEAARITFALLPSLEVPLHTTQLILAHQTPITISFRKDEHRFDAEGAYNIRYEIIKKRIDKVHLLDSEERLTQPGKVAIVYTNPKEAEEYLKYIEFLQTKKILGPQVEHLELEELQGVYGLKAIRVEVNYPES